MILNLFCSGVCLGNLVVVFGYVAAFVVPIVVSALFFVVYDW